MVKGSDILWMITVVCSMYVLVLILGFANYLIDAVIIVFALFLLSVYDGFHVCAQLTSSSVTVSNYDVASPSRTRAYLLTQVLNARNDYFLVVPLLILWFFYREVYNAICLRLGPTPHIPGDSVQALFNDMQLFPSKKQGIYLHHYLYLVLSSLD